MSTSSKTILTLTDRAIKQMRTLLAARTKPACGVRLNLKTQGCSGMAYALSYVDTPLPGDELVEKEDLKLYIDPNATLFVIGTEMDYNEDPLSPGFVFRNPNEKARCGCGHSFHV